METETFQGISISFGSSGLCAINQLSSDIVKSFEKINKAIYSIGYPDAGYKIWHVQSDTTKNIRFMIQGSWPDQEVYNTIHKNELYLNAMKELKNSSSNLKQVFYNRFTLVK